jgi:hypothetical protein
MLQRLGQHASQPALTQHGSETAITRLLLKGVG